MRAFSAAWGTLLLAALGAFGATNALAATQSFSYAGSPVPIEDAVDAVTPGALASASLSVAGLSGQITKVVLRIDGTACSNAFDLTTAGLDHNFAHDLVLTLRSPSGSIVTLFQQATDPTAPLVDPARNFCQTTFDDDAVAEIQNATSADGPFTGAWRPATPLAALNGATANGTWQLRAQDFAPVDAGNIRAFTLTITTASSTQTITFPVQTPASHPFTSGGTFPVLPLATASSGLPVSYSSLTTGVCTVAGTNVTMVAAGTCTLAADQPGDLIFAPAPQVTRDVVFTVSGVTAQTITFPAQTPASQPFAPGNTFPISPTATASSGLPVTYSSLSPSVCTVAGTTVTMVSAGNCQLAANQGGNAAFAAAPQVVRGVTLQAAVVGVPTLGQWGLMLLSMVAAGLGARRLRRHA